ncbi:hypothetical protein C8Q80DRAFT_456349 [Daedaleopsis nitida]|nr:hypothetical protein C8Q80DRAFT_456349 [Daedaleopsis nitida]
MTSVVLPDSYMNALDIGKQSRAGALGLLMYDHFLTLGLEIEVVWRQSKRTWTFWIYAFNRFFPLVWLVLDMNLGFACVLTAETHQYIILYQICIIYLGLDDLVIVVATLGIQIILQLRVYALYEKSRRIRLFLICCCVLEIAVMAVFLGVTFSHISGLPVVSTATGCYYSGIFSTSAFFWLPALVFEPMLCLLAVWKAWGEDAMHVLALRLRWGQAPPPDSEPTYQGETPRIMKMFARDSLIYFIGIAAELIVNTVIWSRYNRYINIIVP